MNTMKKGMKIGCVDKNGNSVHVGDKLRHTVTGHTVVIGDDGKPIVNGIRQERRGVDLMHLLRDCEITELAVKGRHKTIPVNDNFDPEDPWHFKGEEAEETNVLPVDPDPVPEGSPTVSHTLSDGSVEMSPVPGEPTFEMQQVFAWLHKGYCVKLENKVYKFWRD